MRGTVIGIIAGTIFLSVCARGQFGLPYTNWMGDQLIDRPLNNALVGQVAIYCGPSFDDFGRIVRWEYFDNDSLGASVTPIIFQRLNETDFRIWAIGAARESNGRGVRNAIFDLEKGTDERIGPGFTFGFVERHLFDPDVTPTPPGCMAETSRTTGVVDYEISSTGQWAYTTNDGFGICVGQIYRLGGLPENNVVPLLRDFDAPRTYSARVIALLYDPPLRLTVSRNGEICWLSRTNRQYQLQWTPTLETNITWQDLGSVISGDGHTTCVSESFQELGQRFYRVLTKVPGP